MFTKFLTQQHRRHFMTCLAALLGLSLDASWAAPGITADKIVIGQSVALTGPLGELGQEVSKGSQAYFAALNAKGGIQGRKVELLVKDDAYDPKKAHEINTAWQDQVFAFFTPFGTGPSEAVVPIGEKNRIPVLMPYSGSSTLRKPGYTMTANLRASYEDEARHMIKHLASLGLTQVAIAYQDASFGREVLRAATEALGERKLAPVASAAVKGDSSNVAAAVGTIAASKPLSVIIGIGGKPAVDTVLALQKAIPGIHIYALSVFSNTANLTALGKNGIGINITQVMPFPLQTGNPLARQFKTDMLAAGFRPKDLSHASFEGYINAAIFAEAMNRAGKDPSRETFMRTLYAMKDLTLGGTRFGWRTANAQSGSQRVLLTFINSAGVLAH